MYYICILIIFLYTSIHFLEFSSFYSRISGIHTGYKLLSYSVQQTTFVFTRFFFIFLMPLLGLIVDQSIPQNLYLLMVIASLLGASISYLIAFLIRKNIIAYFSNVIINFNNHGYLKSFIKAFTQPYSNNTSHKSNKFNLNKPIMILSSFIFSCYSVAVFISFYFALVFYEYRTSISQLSGVINAFATLVLTIYIEPKISKAIDSKSDSAESDVYSLLIGRFIGVSIISPAIIIIVVLFL